MKDKKLNLMSFGTIGFPCENQSDTKGVRVSRACPIFIFVLVHRAEYHVQQRGNTTDCILACRNVQLTSQTQIQNVWCRIETDSNGRVLFSNLWCPPRTCGAQYRRWYRRERGSVE